MRFSTYDDDDSSCVQVHVPGRTVCSTSTSTVHWYCSVLGTVLRTVVPVGAAATYCTGTVPGTGTHRRPPRTEAEGKSLVDRINEVVDRLTFVNAIAIVVFATYSSSIDTVPGYCVLIISCGGKSLWSKASRDRTGFRRTIFSFLTRNCVENYVFSVPRDTVHLGWRSHPSASGDSTFVSFSLSSSVVASFCFASIKTEV